jgi:glycerol kinase
MNDALLLAIDQGTHSTRALVFDAQGRAVAHASRPVTLQRFSPHKAEQSPVEILGSLQQVLQSVLDNPLVDRSRIQAAGLATQRSSVIAWDRTSGTPLSPVLSWQDRRSAEAMERLAAQATLIREASGLQLSPHYGAGKLQWLLSRLPAVAEAQAAGTLVMGPLASYLLHHLTDNPAELVDHANASRTLLWNLRTRDWDERLLQLFSIPPAVLPECRPICADYGTTLNGAIPLQAVNGDQTAALHAQGSPRDDTVVVNIGTGAFVLLPVPDPGARPDGLLAGISMSQDHATNYYVEGTVNGAAAALDWAQQRFDVPDLEDKLPDWLATYDAPGLFLNTVNGIGAPWWRSGPEPHFLQSRRQPHPDQWRTRPAGRAVPETGKPLGPVRTPARSD